MSGTTPIAPQHRRSFAQTTPLLALLWLCLLSGCVGTSSLVLGAGAGTATGSGVAYTMDSIAYKTFTSPLDQVAEATRATLKSMEFPIRWESRNTSGVDIMAKAGNPSETLEIEIDLERLSPQVTRMRIVANRGLFLKDAATATEIIRLVSKQLDERDRAAAPAQDQPAQASAPPAKP
ncbi:MAG: DUF3568 family protein [Nitrospirota bacterium]|nr:DUF3568 family protein [Nitrospirota bacterium]MDE3118444.1 DUF3568 family protein [Nitrospirota bacterium]